MLYVLYVADVVTGVTQLGVVVYVVCRQTPIIKMYSVDTLSPVGGKGIHVKGMRNPSDIVVCRDDRQLYVADHDFCIWRVSADDHSYVKWLPTESKTEKFSVWTLSVTSRRLLVTSYSPPRLYQYSTTDRQLLRVVCLPGYVKALRHAVETTRSTFVVCNWGTSNSGVSELFKFCHVSYVLGYQ